MFTALWLTVPSRFVCVPSYVRHCTCWSSIVTLTHHLALYHSLQSRSRRARRGSRSRGNTPSDTASTCSSGSSDKVRPTPPAAPPAAQTTPKRPGPPLEPAEEGATPGKRRRGTDVSVMCTSWKSVMGVGYAVTRWMSS